jgi:hypothetical protein
MLRPGLTVARGEKLEVRRENVERRTLNVERNYLCLSYIICVYLCYRFVTDL